MSHSPDQKKNNGKSGTISRRSFLKGLGVGSVSVATVPGTELLAKLKGTFPMENGKLYGPNIVSLQLQVNGKNMPVRIEPRMTLADVLRDELQLTGTKIGCDRGACGACTVILDGKTVNACMTLALDAIGKKIQTVEGLALTGKLHDIQESFIEHDALQCGFCTSGMIMSCKNLLDANSNPSLQEVKVATSGNLCRCGTYPKVFEAVLAVNKKH